MLISLLPSLLESASGHQGSVKALVLLSNVFIERKAPFKDISKLAVNSNSIGCGTNGGINMDQFYPFYPCRSISLVLSYLICIYSQLWELP